MHCVESSKTGQDSRLLNVGKVSGIQRNDNYYHDDNNDGDGRCDDCNNTNNNNPSQPLAKYYGQRMY